MRREGHRFGARRRRLRGFTIVELMIAIILALFLMGGLFAMVQSNRRAFTSQTTMSSQQDSQRFALSVLSEVIQGAGYFPDPVTQTASGLFPAVAPFTSVGQVVAGTSGGANGSTITVRYYATAADSIINCDGSSPVLAGVYTNQFSVNVGVDPNTGLPASQLVCSMNGGAPVPLVDNVKRLDITYGVNTQGTNPPTVHTYIPDNLMTAANWQNVLSVRIRVTFNNALATNAATQTIPLTRTIAIMGVL